MLKDVKDKRNDEAKPNELPYRNNQKSCNSKGTTQQKQ